MNRRLILAAASGLVALIPLSALGDTPPGEMVPEKVVVVVAIPTPPGITGDRLRDEFTKAATRYQQIPGLIRKYFTIGDGNFGGVYYWTSKAAAQAWFNDAWFARVKATYGSAGNVTYYTVPLAIEGAHP